MNRKMGVTAFFSAAIIFVLGYSISSIRLSGQIDKRTSGGRISVIDFGAVGDGKTDDTAAIQDAIDFGDEIHFPDVSAFYRVVGSLQIGGRNQVGGKRLIGHRPCRGGGGASGKSALIQGDGSATLFLAKGTTKQNRAIELAGLSALNAAYPVLDMTSGVDGMVDNCWFRTVKNKDACIRLRESYNVTIRESTIGCSGGGFAITAYQQCNKLRIQSCRLYGGDSGGGVHVEQSSSVQIEGNLLELGVYGFVVSSGVRLDHPQTGNVEGAGVCHAIRITSNYMENIQHPMVIASAMNVEQLPGQAVFGAVIESNSFGVYTFDFPLLTIGRLSAATIRGNSFWRKADGHSAAIHVTSAHGATQAYPTSCVIEANHLTNGNGPFINTEDVKIGGVPLSQKFQADNRISVP